MPSLPQISSELLKMTQPSAKSMQGSRLTTTFGVTRAGSPGPPSSGSPPVFFVAVPNIRSFVSSVTAVLSAADGFSSSENICLPVHSMVGLSNVAGGRSIRRSLSCWLPMKYDARRQISWRDRNTSLDVSRYAHVRKSCVAATRISPFLGVDRFCATPRSSRASALASSVCGTCRFISSPSKSALYGAHTHSLNRSVLPSSTLTRCAIIDSRCRDGCLLNRTMSPSSKCRSTTSPTFSRLAKFFSRDSLLPYLSIVFSGNGFRSTPSASAPCPPSFPWFQYTNVAPGYSLFPLTTNFRSFSILFSVTFSGYVSIIAICRGTPTSSTPNVGSGEITVRPEKSTRFPLKFPLNLPCFPFSRCTKPLVGFPGT